MIVHGQPLHWKIYFVERGQIATGTGNCGKFRVSLSFYYTTSQGSRAGPRGPATGSWPVKFKFKFLRRPYRIRSRLAWAWRIWSARMPAQPRLRRGGCDCQWLRHYKFELGSWSWSWWRAEYWRLVFFPANRIQIFKKHGTLRRWLPREAPASQWLAPAGAGVEGPRARRPTRSRTLRIHRRCLRQMTSPFNTQAQLPSIVIDTQFFCTPGQIQVETPGRPALARATMLLEPTPQRRKPPPLKLGGFSGLWS